MRKLQSLVGWAAAVAVILSPCEALAVSGSVTTPYTYASAPGSGAGFGYVECEFKNAASQAYGTEWRLITANGPELTWRPVIAAGTNVTIKKEALAFGLEFRRTSGPAASAPALTTVAVNQLQKVTVIVKYQ